ncbi:MAG: hypothetical protein Q9180_007234, partial [Flavoplaca navasiana]
MENTLLIGSVRRVAARGWGNQVVIDACKGYPDLKNGKPGKAVIEEFQVVISAFAFIIARNLVKDDEDRDASLSPQVYDVDEQHLLEASRFLFDNPHITHGQIDTFVKQYTFQALDGRLPKPPALEAATRSVQSTNAWDFFCDDMKGLSVYMLALAHIMNLEECENLMFAGLGYSDLQHHPLVASLDEWNGRDALPIGDDAWLRAVAVPLTSQRQALNDHPWHLVCLVSDKGWSAWIPTLAGIDPSYVRAGSVMLGRGSPCRNGVWKKDIWDVSCDDGSTLDMDEPQRAESCGQITSLRCAKKVTLEIPYCGEGDDRFVVSARFRTHRIQKSLHR